MNFIKKTLILTLLVTMSGCILNDNKEAKYELYFQNRSKLGYMEIYDNLDTSKIKYVDYKKDFKVGVSEIEISNNKLYLSANRNVSINRLLNNLYVINGDEKKEEIELPETGPEEMFIDNNKLYVFYATFFSAYRPDGGLLTVIDTDTNKVIDNKRVFGSLQDPPKVYKDKIYMILKIANELGYKEYSDSYLASIDRNTHEIKKMFDTPDILDFDIYEDHIYMIRYVKISKEKELFYLIKTDCEGNEISQKKIDYDTTNIVIKDDGIAYFYNDYNRSTSVYIYDLKEDKLIKEIKDFGLVHNIEFIDNLLFIPGYKGNNILIIDRDNFEVVKEIELPDDVRLFDIKVKKAE